MPTPSSRPGWRIRQFLHRTADCLDLSRLVDWIRLRHARRKGLRGWRKFKKLDDAE